MKAPYTKHSLIYPHQECHYS